MQLLQKRRKNWNGLIFIGNQSWEVGSMRFSLLLNELVDVVGFKSA